MSRVAIMHDELPQGPDKKRAVEEMFDRVAPRYERMNRVISLGLDRRWRRRTVGALGLPAGSRVLLLYPSCIDYMVGFFGCLCAGMIAVPIFPPRNSRHNVRLEAISRVARALTTPGALHEVAERALDAMRAAMDLQVCVLYLPDAAERPLLTRFETSPREAAHRTRDEIGFDPAAWQLAIAGGHPLVFNEPAGWVVPNPFEPPASHWLVVPLATADRLVGAVIRGPPLSFAVASSSRPSQLASRHTPARMAAAFSPMPAVNTTASRPPSAAASEPSSRRMRYKYRSTASFARGSSLASSVRMSLEIPDTPSKPDWL